jgi:hypothetical protein
MKHFTFNIRCVFEMQFTWPASQVEDAAGMDGREDDSEAEPTGDALVALENELHEYLSQRYPVSKVRIPENKLLLLGSDEEP